MKVMITDLIFNQTDKTSPPPPHHPSSSSICLAQSSGRVVSVLRSSVTQYSSSIVPTPVIS